VALFTCKDAAERGRLSASTFRTLCRGLALSSLSHLGVTASKVLLDNPALYPSAISVAPVSAVTLAMHVLAVLVCGAKGFGKAAK